MVSYLKPSVSLFCLNKSMPNISQYFLNYFQLFVIVLRISESIWGLSKVLFMCNMIPLNMAAAGNFVDSGSWVWIMESITVVNYRKMENNFSFPLRSEHNTLYIKSSICHNPILLKLLLYMSTFLQSKKWLQRKEKVVLLYSSVLPMKSEIDIFYTVGLQ